MFFLTKLAVARRSVTILIALAVFGGGVASWGSLKQELLPNIDFPIVTIIAPYPGAGTADVAEQVAAPIEAAVASSQGSNRSAPFQRLGLASSLPSLPTGVTSRRSCARLRLPSPGPASPPA